jgi:hypothetical protein
MLPILLDAAGHRRQPVTLPGYHAGRAPRNKGRRYPADPPTVEEIIAVMRSAGAGHDRRASARADRRAVASGVADRRSACPRRDRPRCSPRGCACPPWQGRQASRGRDGQLGESAGINRHGEGDENALHRRRSESRWPRVMRWRSVRAQRSVDKGRVGGVFEPRNSIEVRVPTFPHVCGRQYCWRRYSRVAGGPCAVGEPRHARRAPCARTGRSRGRPRGVGDAPSWMVRGVADRHWAGRGGNA